MKDPSDLEIEVPFIKKYPNIMNFFEIVPKNNLEDRLSVIQIQELQELLCKYSRVFSNEQRLTNLMQHDIEFISDKPVRTRPYRLSPKQNEILKREVNIILTKKYLKLEF